MGRHRKRVFNRGECRQHNTNWEEPLLKRIKHLTEGDDNEG
jgi:hypothetical protein